MFKNYVLLQKGRYAFYDYIAPYFVVPSFLCSTSNLHCPYILLRKVDGNKNRYKSLRFPLIGNTVIHEAYRKIYETYTGKSREGG